MCISNSTGRAEAGRQFQREVTEIIFDILSTYKTVAIYDGRGRRCYSANDIRLTRDGGIDLVPEFTCATPRASLATETRFINTLKQRLQTDGLWP